MVRGEQGAVAASRFGLVGGRPSLDLPFPKPSLEASAHVPYTTVHPLVPPKLPLADSRYLGALRHIYSLAMLQEIY